MSRRVKITFKSVNGDNFSVIPHYLIAQTNARIKIAMKKFNTTHKSKMFPEQPDPNAIYGSCIHGENMVRCRICNHKEVEPIILKMNDPRYCYFIENEKGEWLIDRFDETLLTIAPLKAMSFTGVNGKAMASIFLGLMQSKNKLLNFIVTEHEFT